MKSLHRKVDEIKSSVQIGVEYMKMEERDRLIRKEGEKAGEEIGRKVGQDRMGKLIQILVKEKRFEELERAAVDEMFREELLRKFGI